MKKVVVFLAILCATGLSVLFAHAQSSQPPGFPTIDDSSTATDTATVEATQSATTVISTVTPTPISAQTATDDAQTGPELFILAGVSLLGGLGIYLIKKYFDLRKYEL